LGACGSQGGSVVRSLLKDGTFNIRGVTRKTDSEKSQEFQRQGVEMIYGDTTNPKSLKDAFKNAFAAYIVVNFWDPDIKMKEQELTKKILDIAKDCGIQQILLAGLPDVEKFSNGKLDVPHFTMKAKSVEYAKTLNFKYFTNIEAAYYYSNWFTFFKPTKIDGTWTWTLPVHKQFSQFDPQEDIGPAALTALKHPEMWNGRDILLQGDYLSPNEVVRIIGEVTGKPTQFKYLSPDEFISKNPGMEEMTEMFSWFDEFGYYGPESETRQWNSGRLANPNMRGFQDWMECGAWKDYYTFE
jgi:uncharacterized protein YbjT (DUF2867 family)